MDILSLDVAPQTLAILGFMVISVVKLIDLLFNRDWKSAAKIVAAAVVGGAVAFGVDGLALLPGIVLGLSASGLVTTVGLVKPKQTDLG